MRTNNCLKITSVLMSILFITLGFSSCGGPATDTATKNNANTTPINANSDTALTTEKSAAAVCSGTKDTAIVDLMKYSIKPGTNLHGYKGHYNFHVSGCTVYLVGYTGNLALFKELYDLAATTKDVQAVDISGLWIDKADAGAGPVGNVCPGNGVPCGDVCLPQGQICNTKDIVIVPLGSPSPSVRP